MSQQETERLTASDIKFVRVINFMASLIGFGLLAAGVIAAISIATGAPVEFLSVVSIVLMAPGAWLLFSTLAPRFRQTGR